MAALAAAALRSAGSQPADLTVLAALAVAVVLTMGEVVTVVEGLSTAGGVVPKAGRTGCRDLAPGRPPADAERVPDADTLVKTAC